MSDIGQKIKQDILDAIENDSIVLPTLPEIALDVREITESEDSSLFDLIEVINKDTALSARLLKVSNSPLFRGANEITNLNMAVNRLGMQYTSNLATGLVMEQMFQATSEMIDTRMRATWQRSTEVAGISHVMAKHYTKLKPDQATLAGLVHKIGVLPILTFAEDHRKLLKNPAVLEKLIELAHPDIGRKILEVWDFPATLQLVPQEHLHFDRVVDNVDYADVVLVANLQSYIGSEHPFTKMDWSTISAFDRLGLSHEINTHEAEDLSEDMEAAMAFLQ